MCSSYNWYKTHAKFKSFQGAAIKADPKINYDDKEDTKLKMISFMSKSCNKTIKDSDQFYSCLQSLTFSKEEMILDTQMLDYHSMQYTSIPAQWRSFLQVFNHGQCQTVRDLGQLTDSVQVNFSLQNLCRNCTESERFCAGEDLPERVSAVQDLAP